MTTKLDQLKAKRAELERQIAEEENKTDWVKIDYSVIPQEIFEKYGAKPFEIQRRKMRKDGEVWNNINYFDAKKEAEALGYRLTSIQEMLVLLHAYKEQYPNSASVHHKSFLGIEELDYDEDVCYEWVEGPCGFLRGGNWSDTSSAGVFALYLSGSPTNADGSLGFRCSR